MKKTFLFFIVIISSLCSYSQSFNTFKGDTVNYTDLANLKQGKWIYFFENTENISQCGNYKDNKKEGIWFSYYANGKPKSEITFADNLKNGHAKIYYETGVLAEEGTWRFNKWVGAYKSYFPNGNVSYEWNYNESGERSGMQKYYHENGRVKIEGEWDKGKEKGIIKEFYENGELKSEKQFADGQVNLSSLKTYENNSQTNNNQNNSAENNQNTEQNTSNSEASVGVFDGNGFHTFYNKFRKVEKEGTFVKGFLFDGKHFIYDESGKLIQTKFYEKGKVVKTIINE